MKPDGSVLKVALQMYCPTCEVRSGLNSRSRVDTLSLITVLTVIPFSVVIEILPSLTGPSSTVTVQVSVNLDPAMGVPLVLKATAGTARVVE